MGYTKQNAINSLREAHMKTEGTLSVGKYRSTGLKPSHSMIAKLFGSWNEAKKTADLETIEAYQNRQYASFSTRCDDTPNSGYEFWYHRCDGELETVRVHRLVAVAEYGIDAVKNMEVHHKNEIKWDNRPGNLKLMTDSDHAKKHEFWTDSEYYQERV